MKRYLLSMAILYSIFSCNETNPPADLKPATTDSITPVPDSIPAKPDSNKPPKTNTGLSIGLTQEEMMDDSVFIDGSKPTSWEAAGITDVKGLKLFLKQVQFLVLKNDKEQLAKLIRYPLGRHIKTEQDFIKNYDALFTKDVKLSIANINFSQVFRNSKGVMTEGGKIWFTQVEDDFKIVAVNQ